MLPNGNIPHTLKLESRVRRRHHTKKRYPQEQASRAGMRAIRPKGRNTSRTKLSDCHAARRIARAILFFSAPKITHAFW